MTREQKWKARSEVGSTGYPYIKDLSRHPFQTGCASYSYSVYKQPLQHPEGYLFNIGITSISSFRVS